MSLIITFSIIAFFLLLGIIGYLVWRSKIRAKMNAKPENNIELTNHIKFDIDELVTFLGGAENIISVEAKLNKFKVFFKDRNLLQVDKIKNLIADTIVESTTYLILVLGDMTSKTYERINNEVKQIKKKMDKKEQA